MTDCLNTHDYDVIIDEIDAELLSNSSYFYSEAETVSDYDCAGTVGTAGCFGGTFGTIGSWGCCC